MEEEYVLFDPWIATASTPFSRRYSWMSTRTRIVSSKQRSKHNKGKQPPLGLRVGSVKEKDKLQEEKGRR
jgi:hypothetical protein